MVSYLCDPEDIERHKLIRQKLMTVDLEVEYGRIQETYAVKEKISLLLQDTEYKPMTDNIVKFFSNNKNKRINNRQKIASCCAR